MDHVYAGGAYSGTADFDPGPGVEEHTSYNSWFDAYLSRFDTEGTFEWVRVWGGPAHQSVDGLDVDTQGNVFVAGIFHFAVDFDPGPGTAEYFGCALGSGYLSKFDSYGEFQWVWPLVSNASTSGECVSVTASNLGTVSVTGDFAGTVDFDPGPDLRTRTAKNLQDVFVTCLDPNGAFLWVDTWGGEEYDGGQAIASDAGGNLFVAGRFRHTVDFDPGPSIEYHTPSGSTDAFLCKLLPDGQW
jgi:hypothetical protein